MTYDYLIIGGGQVADDASRAIRDADADGSIGILSADQDAPYTRPALSKKLWTDPDFDEGQVPLNTVEDTGAELHLHTEVTSIDREARTVTTADGTTYGYGKLLLATGSTPGELDGPDDDRVIPFRSFADYRRLRDLSRSEGEDARFVVIGGGYIGNEIAAALATNGVRTTLISPDDVLLGSKFPPALAERYQKLFADGGVELLGGHHAESVTYSGGAFAVLLDDGTEVEASVVVEGLGAAPALDLARDAGLSVSEGVIVDEHLVTSDPAIWAAGDIAEYPDAILGRTRVEHVDNAQEMGAAAGASMAGSEDPYDHTPYFYSQVFGNRWEAVGTLDPSLETLEVDLDEDRTVVYYLQDGAAVGVLLWNVEEALDAARQVLKDAPTDHGELRSRIR